MSDNILERIFNTPDEDAKTFMESVPDLIHDREGEVKEMMSGQKKDVVAPRLSALKSGKIVIEHGYDNDDYVWHISPVTELSDGVRRRQVVLNFKVPEQKLLYSIMVLMKDVVPSTCHVKIFLPMNDWDLKVYTFKAIGIRSYWEFTESRVEQLVLKLFATLNEYL